MKNRSGGWVLLLSVFALFQWNVQSGILNEYNQPLKYALSPTYLQYLAGQERKISNVMKVYEAELHERLNLVKKYLKDYESSTVVGTFHLDSEEEKDKMVVQHPLLAFRMLSRFAKEYDAIDRHINGGAEKVVSEVVVEAKGYSGVLPIQTDVEDAVDAILRMQFMYALPSAQIANGQIPGVESIRVNLTTEQCYYIAENALTTRYYALALEWFDEIKRRIKNDPQGDNYGLTESSLDDDILAVIKDHNNVYEEEFEDGNEYLYSEIVWSVVEPRPSTMRYYVVSRYSTAVVNKSHPNYPKIIFARNIALCNGQNIRSPKDESKLKCWLDHNRNPYWRILPLKIELLNDFPQVIQIHDIIPNSWISELKKAAYTDLEKPPDTGRTAGYSWFFDEHIPKVPLSRRVELATGLNVRGERAAEALQVAAYALGGHVDLHFDIKIKEDMVDPKGHRVLTFLFYLNDVEIGGLTSFPELGFYVEPKKGSAVLWNPNKMDGTVDKLMLHGACPMLYGEKWIGTKWVHSEENMFRSPCGLEG